MMEFETLKYALNLTVFYIPNRQKLTKIRTFLYVLISVPFIVTHIFMLIYYISRKAELYTATLCAFYVLACCITMYRQLHFLMNSGEISAILQMFQDPPKCKSQEFNRLEIEMKMKSAKQRKKFIRQTYTNTQGILLVLVLTFFGYRIVTTLLHQLTPPTTLKPPARLLMFGMWWFTNPRELPTYYFIIALQSLIVSSHLLVSCSTDTFSCSLMLAAAERASLLARTAPTYLMAGPRGELTRRFRTWIKYHQHYLKIVAKLDRLIGPLILSTYSGTIIAFMLMSYIAIKINDNYMQSTILAATFGSLTQIYMISRAAEKLSEQSILLSRSVVSAAQVSRGGLKTGPARSALQVLVTRLSGGAEPEHVTAMGFFTVNMEYFTSVLSVSFSYVLFLINFNAPGRQELDI